MHDRDKVLSNTPCLVPGGKRFGEKNTIMLILGMAWEGHGWRRDELMILSWRHECINLKTWLEAQGRVQPHMQPLVSLELFMRLPEWLCPVRNIRTLWKPQDSGDAETDGHSLPVANPSGDPGEVPKKGWFLPNKFWPPQGIAGQLS